MEVKKIGVYAFRCSLVHYRSWLAEDAARAILITVNGAPSLTVRSVGSDPLRSEILEAAGEVAR